MATKTKKRKTARKTNGAKKTRAKKSSVTECSVYDTLLMEEDENIGSSDRPDFWKLGEPRSAKKPSTATVRLIPFDNKLFAFNPRHWVDSDTFRGYASCSGKDCPLCSKEIRLDKKFLVNVVVREASEDPDLDNDHVIMNCPITLKKKLSNLITMFREETPLDLKKGFDFKIIRTGKGKKTEYDAIRMSKKSSVMDLDPADLNSMVSSMAKDPEELEEIARKL